MGREQDTIYWAQNNTKRREGIQTTRDEQQPIFFYHHVFTPSHQRFLANLINRNTEQDDEKGISGEISRDAKAVRGEVQS